MAEDTISAVITALGEGAVGIVRISGERALAVGERLFKAASGKALAAYAANTMVYGHIYDEDGRTVYTVEGKLSWGHCLHILDARGEHIGTVQEKVFTLLPKFELYIHDQYVGSIQKQFTFFQPRFDIDCNGWQVEGSFLEWDYTVREACGALVATISKELFNWTDTYVIDVMDPKDALCALMLVLAIDAEKCSRN